VFALIFHKCARLNHSIFKAGFGGPVVYFKGNFSV
jgi:hypothetical protein